MKFTLLFLLAISAVFASNNVEEFLGGSYTFMSDVYNQLSLDNKENIIVSPFSAETIVALIQSGAVGETGEEIRSKLHFPNTKEGTEGAFKYLLPFIDGDRVFLYTANRIFVEEGLEVREEFRKVARDVYRADFDNVDFSKTQETADEINQWVEEETNNRIRDLISPDDLGPDTKLVLVNALYFQGNWSIPFNPRFTKASRFHTSEDSSVDSSLMYQRSALYNYAESEQLDAQILEVPFLGGDAAMTVVLPNKIEGIAVLEKQIRDVWLTPLFSEEFVEVQLPKFKIESTIDLKDILEKIGVHKAFDSAEADFSGIAGEKGDLFVGEAKQKVYIDVNEIGVEAAAATDIGTIDGLPSRATKRFIADHPFIFFIKVRNIVLFEGRVLLPEYD